MFTSKYSVPVLTAVLAVLAFAAPARAQRAAGPFAGILGGDSEADATQSLQVRGSLFGAWYDTLSQTGEEPVDDQFLRSGGAAGASGSLSHLLRGSRLQWQSNAASSMRLFGAGQNATAATFYADSSLSGSISRRVSLSGSGRIDYSPYYDFAPGLDGRLTNVGAFGGGFGVATDAERNLSTSASAGMNVRITRRDTFDAGGSVSRYEFLDQEATGTESWGVFGRFGHTFSRSLSLNVGFARLETSYDGLDSATSDSIDIGVNYNDTLTFARRTAFSFGASTSAVRWEETTHYNVNGTATLTHGFGRSGSASLSYQRGTQFDPAFREPVLNDSVRAGVNNQLGRRAAWSVQVGYERGEIGYDDTGSYNSVTAGGGVNVAVTRHVGIFTDYSIYRYEVPPGATVFTSLSKFARHSVSAGLTLWAPIISDKRSTSDTR